jgi:hypothetical protein
MDLLDHRVKFHPSRIPIRFFRVPALQPLLLIAKVQVGVILSNERKF